MDRQRAIYDRAACGKHADGELHYMAAPGTASVVVTVHTGHTITAPMTVPIGGAAQSGSYTLTVVNGTGSGSYSAGTVVNISVNAAPPGKPFQGWTGTRSANPASSFCNAYNVLGEHNRTASYAGAASSGLAITSVTPNPLPVGSGLVLRDRHGVATGATIWVGNVQYTSAQPAADTLTTSPYIAPGTSSLVFTVHSNGSVSAPYTVPVAGPPTYALTVVGGTGSGSYTAGTNVTVTANAAPSGELFGGWTDASSPTRQRPRRLSLCRPRRPRWWRISFSRLTR